MGIRCTAALIGEFTDLVLYCAEPESGCGSRGFVGDFVLLQASAFFHVTTIVLGAIENVTKHVSEHFSAWDSKFSNGIFNIDSHFVGTPTSEGELLNSHLGRTYDVQILFNECGGFGNVVFRSCHYVQRECKSHFLVVEFQFKHSFSFLACCHDVRHLSHVEAHFVVVGIDIRTHIEVATFAVCQRRTVGIHPEAVAGCCSAAFPGYLLTIDNGIEEQRIGSLCCGVGSKCLTKCDSVCRKCRSHFR